MNYDNVSFWVITEGGLMNNTLYASRTAARAAKRDGQTVRKALITLV